ncbi:hypothetical protein BSCH_01577 [Candidatus Paraburkholderia schumanniana]|nr:hypothetical protein BSCH_01577 [Candidatus Paraburkholderia schumannianae]
MNQVMVGVFGSWRDGHEALRALQLAGLRRDDAHLYRAARSEMDFYAPAPLAHDEDDAEYIAHGEHQGVIARNRPVPTEPIRECAPGRHMSVSDATPRRTLLVIRMTGDIAPDAVGEVLHAHGAITVKDTSGHWRFSPFRNPARV